ncbi:hypothetical protein VQH23_26345 (plasmid) [Pararoseomonas sp. SCSIO 73927]|uniref:hypothetical protein n=1 Tax=Pararoseomonas sp. SCSIO 73927 TaxID=3114537 RepID=UPI0030D225F4
MANGQEFFTAAEITHFAGAVAMIIVVTRVIRHLSKVERPAVTMAVALVVAYLSAGAAGNLAAIPWQEIPHQAFFSAALSWVLPSVNACLLFMAALGTSRLG